MAQTWKTLKSGFSFDAGEFKRKFPEITKVIIPARAKDGLHFAGSLLIRDAIKIRPYAPHRWGDLWRSQTITPVIHKDGGYTIRVGFNLAYAARLHEAPDGWNWTLKGSGPKYLSTKMELYKNRYMQAVAEVIKSGRAPGIAGGAKAA
jgi:hypothetical protein